MAATKHVRLAVIGGGNMGSALVHGLLRAGHRSSDLAIVEVKTQRRVELCALYPQLHIDATVPRCDEAIIAVKPPDVSLACTLAVAAGARRVVSIAAGVSLASLEQACGAGIAVVRAMPNTPAVMGLAATAITTSRSCTSDDCRWARTLLESVGIVIELEESMLDAFTGLVGSGPAYIFYVAESLQAAAVAQGFDEATSAALIAQLLTGAAALLQREPQLARELRERVTSPNGTTAAGIAALEQHHVQDAIVAAVHAATRRSKELGDG